MKQSFKEKSHENIYNTGNDRLRHGNETKTPRAWWCWDRLPNEQSSSELREESAVGKAAHQTSEQYSKPDRICVLYSVGKLEGKTYLVAPNRNFSSSSQMLEI